MKLENIKKIVGIVVIVVLSLVAIDYLSIKSVDSTNITLIKGTFRYIKEREIRGDYSYVIYIAENDHEYVVSADWAKCFNYDDFKNTVKPGQIIQIGLTKSLLRGSMVPALTVNGSDYLSSDCVNGEIHDEKIKIPLFSLGLAICIGLYLKFGNKTKKLT